MAFLATSVFFFLATSMIQAAPAEDGKDIKVIISSDEANIDDNDDYPVDVHIEAAPVDDRYDTLELSISTCSLSVSSGLCCVSCLDSSSVAQPVLVSPAPPPALLSVAVSCPGWSPSRAAPWRPPPAPPPPLALADKLIIETVDLKINVVFT